VTPAAHCSVNSPNVIRPAAGVTQRPWRCSVVTCASGGDGFRPACEGADRDLAPMVAHAGPPLPGWELVYRPGPVVSPRPATRARSACLRHTATLRDHGYCMTHSGLCHHGIPRASRPCMSTCASRCGTRQPVPVAGRIDLQVRGQRKVTAAPSSWTSWPGTPRHLFLAVLVDELAGCPLRMDCRWWHNARPRPLHNIWTEVCALRRSCRNRRHGPSSRSLNTRRS
jgi:hypothetical protein